ncbi:snapalysin family zinc-dependent metalloprotease [Bailinhaonella thermotolerans]|uniref:Extracellular small neutral protease n=1 Tax=Bailinhaonella thermotolerans TaxID=1070861 RepID=A0A3A4BDR3_9ACTN|nr:snapalysin family zinc-dependent metalloprotease [Bailinhaonella thermotolerans]RJL32430.1 snapalysin family zinc-dependent metalloprotease [Bailinhaonella thermotolerans]
MTSRAIRVLLGALLALPLLLAGAALPASAENESLVRVIRYDASRAAEFRAVVDQGAQIWNQSVTNVRFVPGTPADVIIYADNGWPRAQPYGLGRGYVWMGRQAVAQGHYPLRIASHELGHILGLPDRRTGLCSDLMSGASAGTSCRNPYPNATEIAQVERNFQNGVTGVRPGEVITEDLTPVSR